VDIYRHAKLFVSLRDTGQLKGKCRYCDFRQVCGGSRARAFAYTGDPLESDPLCPYVSEEALQQGYAPAGMQEQQTPPCFQERQ
jgi:MoaA/NifB/PqqE/SkfB family radical SAM enzyme